MLVRTVFPTNRLICSGLKAGEENALLKEVQQLLHDKDFYHGPINGLYDKETAAALTLFQMKEGLKTGGITALSLCRLLNAAKQSSVATRLPLSRIQRPPTNVHVLIQKGVRQLTLFNGKTAVRNYPVAIGKPSTPTPVGNYAIASKVMNPGGVLGSRWMGLNYDTYGIHGTPKQCI